MQARDFLLLDGGQTPAPPVNVTRDALCRFRVPFQGHTARTSQFGSFPAFGPETTTLNNQDLDDYSDQILEAGFTHAEIAISWAYFEPGFLMPVPGADLTQNLDELLRRIDRMLARKLTGVGLFLAGDGRSARPNPDGSYPYNDPVGHTYGYEWLMANFERIWRAVMGAGLNKRVLPCPGYDAVFYGWGNVPGEIGDQQPQRVQAFGDLARSIDPDVCLMIEHSTGKIPTGGGPGDWSDLVNGTMRNYDVLLSEYQDPITPGPPGDQVWQVDARTYRPYNRPPNQPADDDLDPPMYIVPTARGPRYKVVYEFATRPWTMGWRDAATVEQDRSYFRAMGAPIIC